MKQACQWMGILLGWAWAGCAWASPEQAEKLMRSWDASVAAWSQQVAQAKTPEERAQAAAGRPDLQAVLKPLWQQIGTELNQPWTLEAAAWFLRAAQTVTTPRPDGPPTLVFSAEIEAIRKTVETTHLKSPGLAPMCMALCTTPDPRTMSLLETIESSHPEPKTQGVAALAAALALKSLGDSPELMRKRLTYLRKAIIQSSEVSLGKTTVAKVAEDELYVIRFLTKGRVAPDLAGVDSAGKALQLSGLSAKVMVLVFWSESMPESERILRMTQDLQAKFKDRQMLVVGVNIDPVQSLRDLEGRAENPVSWKNFSDPDGKLAADYRVGSVPWVYVLDGERKIHFAGLPGSFVELTVEALLSEN